MRLAAEYRQACSDALEQAGPDAPTLCEGWTTRDLAVHLVLRDRRPDALLTSFVPPLRPYATRVKDGYTAKPYEELVTMVREGAPVSPLKIPQIAELANVVEFYVHTQDVLRAASDWTPSGDSLPGEQEDVLWGKLSMMGRLLALRAPTGIEFVRKAGTEPQTATAHPATKLGTVQVTGRASELLLFAFGRSDVAQVEMDGPPEAVSALQGATLGF